MAISRLERPSLPLALGKDSEKGSVMESWHAGSTTRGIGQGPVGLEWCLRRSGNTFEEETRDTKGFSSFGLLKT